MSVSSALIVEDGVVDRQYLYHLCIQLGVSRIEQAENGRQALDILNQHQIDFDVLICDLEMPELDGIELIHRLPRDKQNIGLIIISGKEQMLINAVKHLAIASGLQVLGALQKPIQPKNLAAALSFYKPRRAPIQQNNSRNNSTRYSATVLQQALQQKQLILHYQPKVSVVTGKLVGVEAMARLKLPSGELLYPHQFIPQCEQFHLIDQLSYELVETAALQQKSWAEAGFHTKVAINLSAMSFHSEEFGRNIMNVLKDVNIAASNLIFEVTESSLIRDIAKALYILTRFRLLGAGLSIDNYGTGYSTIKHLSQYPFTELKVDRSLTRGITYKPHLQIIFESILSMCRRLNIELVAEGIETQADWDYIQTAGCHVAQGYYIAPPMPEHELRQWWQEGMLFSKRALPGKKGDDHE